MRQSHIIKYDTSLVSSYRRHGAAGRGVLFDYRKAADLIDHSLLAAKINGLDIPQGVARWVLDFLPRDQAAWTLVISESS